jgi:molecular chaperone GrpE
MEVVEVVADADRPPGTVVEEVRVGYTWRGKVFRFAQVKVAR